VKSSSEIQNLSETVVSGVPSNAGDRVPFGDEDPNPPLDLPPTPAHPRLRLARVEARDRAAPIDRIGEALGEVKPVARYEPETAAEEAILLMERLWPALQAVDSSSGALGPATNKTVHDLIAQIRGEEGKWFATAKTLGLVLDLKGALPGGHRHPAARGP
jgi:hypothetical protein